MKLPARRIPPLNFHRHSIKRFGECAGASAMDMLITVSLLSVGATIGLSVFGEICENARQTKLINDVRTLNSAVCIYVANGGDKSELKDADSVLLKLKQTRLNESRELVAFAGSGQLIDSRIKYVPQVAGKHDLKTLKAYWSSEHMAFKITSKGRPGIHKFFLCDNAGEKDYGVDKSRRDSVFTYAERSKWIWDYHEEPKTRRKGVSQIPLSPAENSAPAKVASSRIASDTAVARSSYRRSASSDDSTGGWALNVGSGNASSSGGASINLLSDDVRTEEGEVAVAVANQEIRLDNVPGAAALSKVTSKIAVAGSDAIYNTVGTTLTTVEGKKSINAVSEALFVSEVGTRLNLGKGESAVSEGVAVNGGSGSADSTNALSGNIGSGSAESANGGALNLGSGSASSGQN